MPEIPLNAQGSSSRSCLLRAWSAVGYQFHVADFLGLTAAQLLSLLNPKVQHLFQMSLLLDCIFICSV
jgi:hypothetical protein